MNKTRLSDYSLVGKDTVRAIEEGLAEATWYASPVPRQEMRKLLEAQGRPRHPRHAPLVRADYWFRGLRFHALGHLVGHSPVHGLRRLYASTSDSRWHEPGHGTAFKTDWMNNALYEIASFMVLRESTRWRWSHARHHSDTIIVGRDAEIAVTRPPDWLALFLRFFGINTTYTFFRLVLLHCTGRLTAEEKTFIPESEYGKVILRARIYLVIYAGVIGLAIYAGSILPLMFIGLPAFYGSWLQFIYGHTQHTGLAENVLDHRLNSRTIYMNAINRYLYWEMNYHVEHHMFPLVPYHNLARLHELVKADMPKPYSGLWEAWREIVPAVFRQWKDPSLLHPTKAADADDPRRCPRCVARLHREGPAGERLGRDLRRRLPAKRRCHPLRPRRQDLRHLPHRRRQSSRHRRPLHS